MSIKVEVTDTQATNDEIFTVVGGDSDTRYVNFDSKQEVEWEAWNFHPEYILSVCDPTTSSWCQFQHVIASLSEIVTLKHEPVMQKWCRWDVELS